MCAFLIVVLYLFVHWRYRLESLSVFIFPLVFVMALVATLGNPVGAWSSPVVRNAWLTCTSCWCCWATRRWLFTAVASLLYLFQERELKRKKPRKLYYRLPPLGTLDELISQIHGAGLRADDAGGDRRQHLGVHRTQDRLDQPAGHRHLVHHLGHLPGDGVSARHRRMARPQGRHHGDRGGGAFALSPGWRTRGWGVGC